MNYYNGPVKQLIKINKYNLQNNRKGHMFQKLKMSAIRELNNSKRLKKIQKIRKEFATR